MKRIVFLVFIFFVICFLNFSFANNINAVSSMRVTPAILEDLVEPGEIIKKEIKVVNYSDGPVTMYAYIMDFKAADESGKAELIAPNTEDGNYLSSWLDITGEAIEFNVGQERVISFVINVPESVGPGGYYGAVVFGTEPPKVRADGGEKGAAVSISQHTASLILLQVAGDVDENAIIKEFNANKRFYTTPFEVDFYTKIKNLGNVHIKPRGIIETRNMLGKKVSVITINDDGGNILPESERVFRNSWKENFGFGRYESSLAVSFGTPAQKGGEGRKTLAIKTYFWIFPTGIIVPIVIGLIVTMILFVVFLKMYKKRAIKKAMEQFGVRGGRDGYVGKRHYSETREFVKNFLIILVASLSVIGAIYFLLF